MWEERYALSLPSGVSCEVDVIYDHYRTQPLGTLALVQSPPASFRRGQHQSPDLLLGIYSKWEMYSSVMENVNTYKSRENRVMNRHLVITQLQQISPEQSCFLFTSIHCGPHMEFQANLRHHIGIKMRKRGIHFPARLLSFLLHLLFPACYLVNDPQWPLTSELRPWPT